MVKEFIQEDATKQVIGGDLAQPREAYENVTFYNSNVGVSELV